MLYIPASDSSEILNLKIEIKIFPKTLWMMPALDSITLNIRSARFPITPILEGLFLLFHIMMSIPAKLIPRR
jgi:hypothetical protein